MLRLLFALMFVFMMTSSCSDDEATVLDGSTTPIDMGTLEMQPETATSDMVLETIESVDSEVIIEQSIEDAELEG